MAYSRFARCASCLLSCLLSVHLSGQVARRLTGLPSPDAAQTTLPNSAAQRGPAAERLGPLPGDIALSGLTLVLKPAATQDEALTELLANQQNPASPDYHKWLTPQQFGERFGLADEDLALLRVWLERAGLRVDDVAASRNAIRFSGSAAEVAAAFGTTLERFREGGQVFHENSLPVRLPDAVAAVVAGVSGLSSDRPKPQNVRMSIAGTDRPGAIAQYTTTSSKETAHYLVPWDFRQIYGINTLIQTGFDGTGVRIGVIGQSAVDPQQLAMFQGKTGQTAATPTMVLVPNTGASNRISGDEAEGELDLEYTMGSAPGAAVQFIYTGCTASASSTVLASATDCSNNGVLTALGYAVTNNLAPILSLSYGSCESTVATFANTTMEPLLRQANAQGQTVVVSSGDTGAAACDQARGGVTVALHSPSVLYPASSSYVTAVGGTQLNSDSSSDWSGSNNGSLGSAAGYMPETTWNDTNAVTAIESSGGGVSGIVPGPYWQAPFWATLSSNRNVPDVSFAASVVAHPYMVCLGDAPCVSSTGGFTPGSDGTGVGGTSVSAPNFAAMLAVIAQANGGGALGNVNAALYAIAYGKGAASVFHDITTGNNFVPCKANLISGCSGDGRMGYAAGPGYDLATGLGSVSAPDLRTALKALPTRTATLILKIGSQQVGLPSPEIGNPFSVVLQLLGSNAASPTGTVVFQVDGVALTNTPPLYNGSVAANVFLKTLGTHTIGATYSGDGNYDGGTVAITVNAGKATPNFTVSRDMSGNATKTPVQFHAFLEAGAVIPTGNVTFIVDGIPMSPAITLKDGSADYLYPGFATPGIHTLVVSYVGDALVKPSSSRVDQVVIDSPSLTQRMQPMMRVSALPQSASPGTPVTFTATLKGLSSTAPVPTGFVTFTINNVALPTMPLSAAGEASVTTNAPSGSNSWEVDANYSGDDAYDSSYSYIFVSPPATPAPAIALALSASSVSIPSTSVATVPFTVSSVNGFTGPVSFDSAIVSGTGATFSGCYRVSPGVVTALPGAPVNASFAIALTSNSLCTAAKVVRMAGVVPSAPAQGRSPQSILLVLGTAALAFLLRRRRVPRGLLSLLALAVLLGMGGCSGGGGSGGGSPTTTTVPTTTTSTTAGSYVVRVTATAQTTGVSSAATFTLNVQ